MIVVMLQHLNATLTLEDTSAPDLTNCSVTDAEL